MPALLACDLHVGKTHVVEGGERELLLAALGLLQTDHVGTVLRHEPRQLIHAKTHGVDVPSGDPQAHVVSKSPKKTGHGLVRGREIEVKLSRRREGMGSGTVRTARARRRNVAKVPLSTINVKGEHYGLERCKYVTILNLHWSVAAAGRAV